MRKGIVDLGTNTFNLLIGECQENKLTIEYTTKRPVLLGMGGINEGVIAKDAMSRAKEALSEFKAICTQYNVESIKGIGTSALRCASNSAELISFALDELNFSIEIVSGEREAELIYLGVGLSHELNEPSVIMDIGGGSTEFVQANRTGVLKIASLDIGVSRIFQQLNKPLEYSEIDLHEIRAFLDQTEQNALNGMECETLIGSSGSFETLYEMTFKELFPSVEKSIEIPLTKLKETLNECIHSSYNERMQNEWIVPIRKKMLPIAAVKIQWIIEKLEIKRVFVSPYSLKEGAFDCTI
ncbi:MAG: hypothetical protein QNK23_05920 [Crocinitomicaceae bacterium]|nr:hypothetical protein [Crocinitomicaceae bacterium]